MDGPILDPVGPFGVGLEHHGVVLVALERDGAVRPGQVLLAELGRGRPGMVERDAQLTEATLAFGPRSGEEDITIKVGEEAIPGAWATVVTWTPDPEAPYYCVEPWMGPPNSPEHKNGLRFAEPGQVDTFVTEVSLM